MQISMNHNRSQPCLLCAVNLLNPQGLPGRSHYVNEFSKLNFLDVFQSKIFGVVVASSKATRLFKTKTHVIFKIAQFSIRLQKRARNATFDTQHFYSFTHQIFSYQGCWLWRHLVPFPLGYYQWVIDQTILSINQF